MVVESRAGLRECGKIETWTWLRLIWYRWLDGVLEAGVEASLVMFWLMA